MTDVEQRLEHGELEMAVESLCLSLRYEGVIVPDMACSHLLKLGPLLGLDRESVLELDFWTKTLPLLRAAQKS